MAENKSQVELNVIKDTLSLEAESKNKQELFLQELLKLGKVKNPLFFEINFQGKVFHILGTCHFLPFKILPSSVQKMVSTFDTLVLEIDQEQMESRVIVSKAACAAEGILRESTETDYFAMLPENAQHTIQKLFQAQDYDFKPSQVKASFLLKTLEDGFDDLTECMDHEICDLFSAIFYTNIIIV